MERERKAVLLTGQGAAAIAVIRLSGGGLSEFLCRHFSKSIAEGRCVHGEIREGDRVLDDAVVVLLPDGQAADLNVHGGPWVVESVMELARREGFRVTEGGADGETELEREAMAALPEARTREGIAMLLGQVRAWERWQASGPGADEIERMLADRALWWMLHPPRVAIVGKANVGKSTLANQLFARERSITADQPGTTRDWVGEFANIDGLAAMLVDTPGARQTLDPIEQEAISRSQVVVSGADLIVKVVDARDADVGPAREGCLRVVNKVDLLNADAEKSEGVQTVATTGRGVDDLRLAIRRWFGCEDLSPDCARWWTARQRAMLEQQQLEMKR